MLDNENLSGTTKENIICVTYEEMLKLWESKKIDIVLISANRADHTVKDSVWSWVNKLQKNNINMIYIIPATLERMPLDKMTEQDKNNIILFHNQFTELVVAKWLLFEGCNLNCSGCSHFSPLTKHPKMLSVEEFHRDLIQLKSKFQYIKTIQFLGGEPLINKKLALFIMEAHKLFPFANLSIITNGLLIPSLDKETLEIIRNCCVFVHISWYKNNTQLLNDIKNKLEQYQICYQITAFNDSFRLQYNINGTNDYKKSWNICEDRLCHTIVNGKISACYYAATVKHANKYFGLNIPHSEYEYDIYDDNLSAEEIIKKITTPFPLCSYCNGGNSREAPRVPWKKSENKLLTDWFIK